ncbi:MAG: hypothetical protein R3256_09470, partial [Thalassovita sp.]|nr:hypothetical protein [Thalassovita sp.]
SRTRQRFTYVFPTVWASGQGAEDAKCRAFPYMPPRSQPKLEACRADHAPMHQLEDKGLNPKCIPLHTPKCMKYMIFFLGIERDKPDRCGYWKAQGGGSRTQKGHCA